MWAIVDTNEPRERREFVVYGTGHELPSLPGRFIGTFLFENDSLVFHLFEVTQ